MNDKNATFRLRTSVIHTVKAIRLRRRAWLRSALVASLIFAPSALHAEVPGVPSGANVVAGNIAISSAANSLQIDSASSRAIINWNQFSIGAGNTVNFNLPDANSAVLNRVITPNMPSSISGTLNSNGQVYLVNPGGIMVGASGVINTNAFVASTFDIANDNFLAGDAMRFSDNGVSGSIINNGTINTGEGGAHLIANQILNNGTIQSRGGNVTLSGGGKVTLDNGVTYVQPSLDTLGSGISPTAGLIQNSGTIRATGAAITGGEVYLVNPNGKILHDGTITAQKELIAAEPNSTRGGHVQLEANEITLTDNSSIDVSGSHGGGTALVGGDWQGSGTVHQATSVTMGSGATIDASSTQYGSGGMIVLWSNLRREGAITRALGSLLARGGQWSGDGGKIETSGRSIITDGIRVDAGASNGIGGLWLIDPFDYLIDTIAASNIVNTLNTGTSVTVSTTANSSSFGSSGNSAGEGDITVAADIVTGAMSGEATLELRAARHIRIQGAHGIDATQNGNTHALNVKLWADSDNSGDGINILSSPNLKTNGGSLTIGNGNTINLGSTNVLVGGDIYINGSVMQSIQTSGGDIRIHGETIVANTSASGVHFDSAGGDIFFGGVLNSGNQYTYVDGPDGHANSWDWARNDAKNGTAGGASLGDSYMVTITSRLENAIAGIAADYRGAWIGAYRPDPANSYSWQWADGPEGGQTFFVQNAGGGGSSQPGWYNNFAPVEPNGSLNINGESRGQFFGTQGLWNDLSSATTFAGSQSSQYAVLGYVRETNLGPTTVSINAGNGTVTFDGSIGNTKALTSLDVTSSATILNGGTLSTVGSQAYSSDLTMNSTSSARIDASSLTTGGSLSVNAAGGNISLNTNVVTTNASTGDVSMTASGGLTGNGNIALADGRSLSISQSGNSIFQGSISGNNARLIKGGSGDLGLTAVSTYGGSTTVNGGVLSLGAANILPDSTDLIVNANGTFSLNGFNETIGSIAGSGLIVNGAVVRDGLVLWLDAGNSTSYDGTGNTWYDLSGNAYHGTIFGNPTYDANTSLFSFTNNTQYVQLAPLPADFLGSLVTGVTVFTVANFGNSSDTWERIVDLGNTGAGGGNPNHNVILSRFDNSNRLNWEIYTGTDHIAHENKSGFNTAIVNGVKSSFTGTADGSNLIIYKDGLLNTITPENALPVAVARNQNFIGKSNWTVDDTFRGDIGTLMVYNRALSQAEIAKNHQLLFNRSEATLTVGGNNANTTFSGSIENGVSTLNLIKAGTGTLTLSGANTYSGTTTVNAGALHIGSGGTTGTLGLGNVINQTQVVFNRSDNVSVANNISGAGTIAKQGSNSLTLTGLQTYSGTTTIDSGSLIFQNNTAPATSGFDGSGAVTIESLGASFSNALTSAYNYASTMTGVTLGKIGNTANVTVASPIEIDGPISIFGGSLDIAGPIAAGNGNITLVGDSLSLTNNVSSTGSLLIRPTTSGISIGVGTGTGTLNISNSELALLQDGFSSITIGDNNSGTLQVGGLSSLQDDVILRSGASSDLRVTGPIAWSSDNELTLAAGQNIWLLDNIAVNGSNATLNLYYGGTDGSTAPAIGRNFFIDLASRRKIEFANTSANLRIGNELFTLIDSASAFSGMNAGGRVALARELNLGGNIYNNALFHSTFTGKFDGLGNAVDGLVIQNSNGGNIGLFAQLNGSTVRQLGVTNFNITTNSSSTNTEYRIGALAGNVGGLGTPVSSVTSLDGVWSNGVISTRSGSTQKHFFGGGLIGSQNGGFMNMTRSWSLANVSTSGSYSSNLGLGGLVGDIGINTNLPGGSHTTTNSSVVNFDINKSYATGSIVQGDKGAYFGSGGLIGVIFTSGGSLTDSYSWGNVVGTGSFGGIAGFALSGTYERNYTKQASVGAGSVGTPSSYNGSTLTTATNNGSLLPSGWDHNVWMVGSRPTLALTPTPPSPLYVRVNNGLSSIFGDALGLTFSVVDELGTAVSFGSGMYSNLSGTSGSGLFTLGQRPNAGNYSVSYLTGLQLTGSDASQFILNPYSTAANFVVNPRTVTVNTNGLLTKVYDGTNALPVGASSLLSFNNLAPGDTGLGVSIGSGSFNSADVLSANQATLGGLSITSVLGSLGSLTTDYELNTTSTVVNAQITPKPIVVSGITAADKIYDGNTLATLNLSGVNFDGLLNGDVVNISQIVGHFLNKNVGANKLINLNGVTYGGADASNYSFSNQTTATATIDPRSVTISGIGAANKVYDGTDIANIDLSNVIFGNMVSGDQLTISGTAGTFNNKNAGNGKTVSLSGTIFGGADVGNYSFIDQTSTLANITPRNLNITGIVAADKTYDGNTSVSLDTSGLTLDGLLNGDDVTVSIAAAFADKNVGMDKPVNILLTESGNDVGNYAINKQSTTVADILRLASVIWVGGPTGDWSDPANWFGGAIPDLANVANVIIPQGVTPNFDSSVSGPVSIDSLTGGNLQVGGGTLLVSNDLNMNQFNQTGGSVSVGGNFVFDTALINGGSLDAVGNIDGGSFNQNGGIVSTLGSLIVDQLQLIGGEIRYAKLGATSVESIAQATQSAIRDTNTRYTSGGGGNSSGGGIVAIIKTVGQQILNGWSGSSPATDMSTVEVEFKSTETPNADQEVYVRTKTNSNGEAVD